MRIVLVILAAAIAGCVPSGARSGAPAAMSEVRGRLTAGYYNPGKPVAGARFVTGVGRRQSNGRYATMCAERSPTVLTDTLGIFRLPVPKVAASDSAGRTVVPMLCMLIGNPAADVWFPVHEFTAALPPGATLWLDCLEHGERGSPDCVVVTEDALNRRPVAR